MSEVVVASNTDWRGQVANNLSSIVGRTDFAQARVEMQVPTIDFSRALNLPSTRRLNGLNQVSPVAEEVLGFEVTRGQHTEDVMRLTSVTLTNLAQTQPALFSELTKEYNLDSDALILHCVEYMRLHDSATLAFQGAMHGRITINGEKYDEDKVLLGAFTEPPPFKAVSDLLFDEVTLEYYKTSNLDKKIIKKIAEDSIDGKSLLGMMLKKGGDCLPIDSLAYISRDFSELLNIFGIADNLSFSEQVNQVLKGLMESSNVLNQNQALGLPKKPLIKPKIEGLIPSNIVKLEEIEGRPKLVYDGLSTFELYVKHILLRLFFSGSPWIQGAERQIYNYFQAKNSSEQPELLRLLLTASEKELLTPDLLSAFQSYGWYYSTLPGNYGSKKFILKDIGQTLIDANGEITTFDEAFPDLMKLKEDIRGQPLLYLHNKHE
ncbi:MAG: hypothetical protein UR89_C0010G0005 [Candidatus Roizmanbacteria bacterium GW2011_GWA2_35_8]|uniref:Uncharacterized protein n=1 Tax=Candidatus Roizmanbacteria bacterium GW2011_GWA2_35_8 TaxID=1618479 RepID=A0A0G0CY34_9BACT|nr:MAG: hypothetical protein UR89_C0010G0005 [Candidatus Roizmanbacteria bacterium GW2011_GWA2_35_8]